MTRALLLAVALFLLGPPLLLRDSAGKAIHNGDEAIYAQIAREMVEQGHWATPTWEGEAIFPRPPGSFWALAAGRVILGPGERAIRWPLAGAAALEAALLVLLGTLLYRPAIGIVAGLGLFASDLFLGYGRYLESEPFLCVNVVGALVCWELARRRPRWILGWGALLGAALMTKQLVGALPLLAPIVDRLARSPGRVPGRALLRGLLVALLVWLPWHAWAVARHGAAFLDSYLLGNVGHRTTGAMLRLTQASFYLRELWRSEGAFGAIAAAGALLCLGRGSWSAMGRASGPVDEGRRSDLLVGAWAVGVIALFTVARSRYDYYLLLAYPALQLGAAVLLVERLPALVRRGAAALRIAPGASALSVRAVSIAVYLGGSALAHGPRNLGAFRGEEEVRALVPLLEAQLPEGARLYTFNTLPYAARYYASRPVITLVDSAKDARDAAALRRVGMPAPVEHAPELARHLAQLPHPYGLLMPRARLALLEGAPLRRVGESRHYLALVAR